MGLGDNKFDSYALKIPKCIIAKSTLRKKRKPDGHYLGIDYLCIFFFFLFLYKLKLLLSSGYRLAMKLAYHFRSLLVPEKANVSLTIKTKLQEYETEIKQLE